MLNGKDVLAMTPNELGAVRWTQGSIVFQGAQHALDPVIRVGDQIVEAILAHGIGRPARGAERRTGRTAGACGAAVASRRVTSRTSSPEGRSSA